MIVYRPASFEEFHGQTAAKRNLEAAVTSASIRKAAVPHVLLSGPAGTGKTTLSYVIAAERNVELTILNATAIDKPKDLVAPLLQLPENGILFIDEIHALKALCEEFLYTAMEDCRITIPVEDGKEPMSVKLDPFTLIGATTREGLLTGPMRDRFQVRERLELYTDEEMVEILTWTEQQFASHQGVTFSHDLYDTIAACCRGTARNVQRFLTAMRDEAVVDTGDPTPEVQEHHVVKTLERLGHSVENRFHKRDIEYLRIIAGGRPVGIKHIAQAMNEDERTIEDTIEPWLVREGYVIRTPQGRTLSELGFKLLS